MIQKKQFLAAALSAALMAGTLAGCGASAAGNDDAADGEKVQIQMCIRDRIRDVPIPKMVKIRQNFDRTHIPETELAGVVTRELDREEIGGKILPGQKIAITCGSRGITHYAVMARAMVDFVKSKGAEPYIVASMGSHGGATAEGQLQILRDYGCLLYTSGP